MEHLHTAICRLAQQLALKLMPPMVTAMA